MKGLVLVLYFWCSCATLLSCSRVPQLFHGRPRNGFLSPLEQEDRVDGQIKDFPALWFNQTVDHFNNADQRTFKQRYYMNEEFYKPGGPAFLFIGGEGDIGPWCITNWAWYDYAQEHQAIMFAVEHRYYGQSRPTEDLSEENMRYLSSEQALADLASFINYAKVKYNLPQNKWIAFGGSYAGSLAAWLRMKYPHLIDGAVATSAPILAKFDFYEYLEVVKSSMAQFSKSCVNNVQKAVEEMDERIQTKEGQQYLKDLFNLCPDSNLTNPLNVAVLYERPMSIFEEAAQYNAYDLRATCNAMNKNDTTPLERYAALVFPQEKCFDIDFELEDIAMINRTDWKEQVQGFGMRQWIYQTCTEFGYFPTSDSKNQPFGHKVSLPFFTTVCQQAFSLNFTPHFTKKAVNLTNINYGGLAINLTKVVFPNGSLDPWHALSVLEDLNPEATAILIPGATHCANMVRPKAYDPAPLVQARKTISKLIAKWIA